MKAPLEFHLAANAYNSYGGAPDSLSLIPLFLLKDPPDFGSALAELTVTLHFQTKRPPRALSSLTGLYREFHEKRLKLPKVIFRRSRQTASIDVASDLMDGDDWRRRTDSLLPLFVAGVKETLAALELLRTRITAKDSFQLESFLQFCAARAGDLPKTEEELAQLKDEISIRQRAQRAALTPWEELEIDFRDFHPDARRVLDDPFFWSNTDDESPNGNDTGSDLLRNYRDWLKLHAAEDPMQFMQDLGRRYGSSLDELGAEFPEVLNQAAVALAFAEIKLRGACRRSAAEYALQAVARQRQAAANWGYACVKSLDAIEEKLRAQIGNLR